MKCRLQVSVGRIFGASSSHLSGWSAMGLGSSAVALPVERKESRSKRGSNGCAKLGYTEQCALASALEWEFLGFRHGTRCTGARVLGSLNKSCGALLLAPRVKPRWWSNLGCAEFPCGSAATHEKFLGRGRKPTNSDEVARALEFVPRHWQKCRCRLAPNRSAGSPCLEVGRTGVRGATEYISGRGFVITALPVLATNQRQ